jgi:tetratricopeptide (TPR) repeat protein
MKRIVTAAGATLALFLLLVSAVAAQNRGTVVGQVFDQTGKPWPDVTVTMKSDSGRNFTVKTDKDGKFTQIGLSGGVWTFTLTNDASHLNFVEQHQITDGQDNNITFNFKDIAASQSGSAEDQKKQQEAKNAFANMKQHFDAGVAAMADSSDVKKQLNAPGADKDALKTKLDADYTTAVTEFTEAEKGVGAGPKDAPNHAVIWANLGQAYDGLGKYDDAANAYQQAIALVPKPEFYANLSTAEANSAASTTDPAAKQQKVDAASAACDKVASLETGASAGGAAGGTTNTSRCWKNAGIVYSNKGDFKDALPVLQKATQLDPKDAQAWYLLGGAYTGMIDSKQEGDKIVYIIPPGTADAYQKVIDLDPNGPYAAQAKAMLDSLTAMGGSQSTTVGEKRKKK